VPATGLRWNDSDKVTQLILGVGPADTEKKFVYNTSVHENEEKWIILYSVQSVKK